MNKVGLLFIATSKYKIFIENLVKSADNFFLKDFNVEYFLFTDEIQNIEYSKRKVNQIKISHKNWPFMTLERYKIFNENSHIFSNFDYLYYIDVDSVFLDEINEEIIGNLVVTEHHGYWKMRGTPEDNPRSTAFISYNENINYVCGGFNGGKKETFLEMSKTLSENIDKDLENDIIAKWHDESHLNRYIIDNKPDIRLSPEYCYHEYYHPHYIFRSNKPKIIALKKDNNKLHI